MKLSKSLLQNLVILFTVCVMLLIIWGVSNGYLLDSEQTNEEMINSVISKSK